jgi:PAS domain S-box-containing protein
MRYIRQFAVFLVLLVVCGFLLYSIYTDIESKTIAQVNNEQMVHAGQAAAGIESFFIAYNDSLSFLAENEHIITLDSDGRDLMRDFYTSHAGEISSITRVDENGIITYTYPVETSTGTDISSQSHVREVMRTHAVVISDVFTSVQGFRTIAFHMPVFQDGRFKGSIAILIPFDTLAKENLGSIRIIDSGYAWTISRNGIVLYSPYPEQVGNSVFDVFNSSPTVTAMAQEAINGSRGITTYTVSGDPARQVPSRKFQAVYLPVTMGNTTWSIIVSTPESEILGTIKGFRNNLLIISAILILSLLFFTYYIARARGIVKEEEKRKKAEDALQESEAKYHRIIETANEGVWILDGDMNTSFVNQRFTDMLGYTRDEILGHNVMEYVINEDKAIMDAQFSVRRKGGKSRYECKLRHRDGRTVWCMISGSPLLEEAGTFRGSFGMIMDITERKKAEEALRESEEKYRTLVESSFDGIAIHKDGILVYVNRTGALLLGSDDPGVFIGKPAIDLIAPAFRQQIAERVRQSPQEAQGLIREQFIRLDGTLIDVDVTTTPTTWNGRPAAYVTFRDIMAQVRAEAALRESEEFNRSLVENLPDIIAIYDNKGIVRFANQAGLQLLGSDLSKVVGQPILSFVVDEKRQDLAKKMRDRLSGAAMSPYEVDIRTGTGELRTALLQAVPITYKNEPVVLVLMTDISERKKKEQALHENEQQLASIYNTVGDTIFQLTVEPHEQYRFTSVNAAFSRTTGVPSEQVIGKMVNEIIPEPALSLVREKYRQAIVEKAIVRWEETSSYPSGQLIGEVSIAPIFDREGNCTHLIGSVHDITERKQAEQRLLEAHRDLERKVAERTYELSEANLHLQELDRLKSLFIASMSHELRTPLNSIIGFTGIMAKGLAGDINAEQKKQLGMVQDSARHLLALINDVIDISKIEADKIEAGVSTFNLADVILEVRNTYGTAAQERGLVLAMDVPALITVTSDERRIRQIIMNLVSNAIKFTDEGRIDVTVEQRGTSVKIRVRDTGIGIGNEDLEQLFRAFGRIAMPGRLTEGTGLGLYLSRKLALFLGGDITVTSEPGRGSVFIFTFPVMYREQENP